MIYEGMHLNTLSREQLIELCNALYELLRKHPVQAPQFVFPVNPPIPYVPYAPPVSPTFLPTPGFPGGTVVCANELT